MHGRESERRKERENLRRSILHILVLFGFSEIFLEGRERKKVHSCMQIGAPEIPGQKRFFPFQDVHSVGVTLLGSCTNTMGLQFRLVLL